MNLTTEQLNVLNHIVVDGQAWADHATEESILAKVARHKKSYDDAVLAGNYENRVQRDATKAKAEQDRKDANYANLPYGDKRAMEYPKIGDQLDDLYRAGIFSDEMAAQLKAIKDKYLKN